MLEAVEASRPTYQSALIEYKSLDSGLSRPSVQPALSRSEDGRVRQREYNTAGPSRDGHLTQPYLIEFQIIEIRLTIKIRSKDKRVRQGDNDTVGPSRVRY